MAGTCAKSKEDKVNTCNYYSFWVRCLLHGLVVRECKFTSYSCRHIDNMVMTNLP
jgi:hypothetical protein